MNQKNFISFGREADAFLQELYKSVGAETSSQKLMLLELKLGGSPNFYTVGGEVSVETKVACLEYEFLETQGLITPELG